MPSAAIFDLFSKPSRRGDEAEIPSLIEGAAEGEERAAADLYARLYPVIRGRIRLRMRADANEAFDINEAQDVVQEVWLTLLKDSARQLRAFDPDRGSLEGYVGLVTERIVGNLRQRGAAQKRRAEREATMRAPEEVAHRDLSPEERCEILQRAEALLRFLDERLPPKGRAILRYVFHDGLEVREVAEAMNVKPQVVYNWTHKIRSLARDFLELESAELES